PHFYDVNDYTIALSGGATLFGLTHVGSPASVGPIYMIEIDYHTALEFIAKASQLTVAFDALGHRYSLWGASKETPNSNSFAYSVLKHCLGEKFDEAPLRQLFADSGWRVPGYGPLVLPDLRFDPDLLPQKNETAADVVMHIRNKHLATRQLDT